MQVIVYGLTMAIHGVADDTSRIDGLSIQRIVENGNVRYVAYSPDLREVLEVNHMHESRRYVSTVQCLDKQMRNLKRERDDLCRRIDRFNEQSLWARLRAVFSGNILE
jgi:hypothetical protein